MINCHQCEQELPADAKFCISCGTPVLAESQSACPYCKKINSSQAPRCLHCGKDFQNKVTTASEAKYPLDFSDIIGLPRQIRNHFFTVFQKVIEAEIDHRGYRHYFDQFYKSGFYKSFDLRTQQLSEEVHSFYQARGESAQTTIDRILEQSFRAFIDHFLVVHAKEIHRINLPEAILRYQKTQASSLDLKQMIFDYLDFPSEPEKLYTDLIGMSQTKLKNAYTSFLFPSKGEMVYFICDQTIFGSCREGFAMTDNALYWKSHFNPAQSAAYHDLRILQRESEWLNINDAFFNVSKSMNLKMLKLLKKIQDLMD